MYFLCATVQFKEFPAAVVPMSQRRVFPPAASAITSGVAQPIEGFQAKSSQTAETLKRQQLHRLRLWVRSAAQKLSVKYCTCNTRLLKKREI